MIKQNDGLQNISHCIFYSNFISTQQWSWSNTSNGYRYISNYCIKINFLITGWNSWYAYQCQPNETLIQLTADIIVVTGLAAAGYEYGLFFYWILYHFFRFCIVNIDDCWQDRRIDGNIQPNSQNFPSGMRALGDYIHSKNLKLGLSSGAIIIFIHLNID